MSLSSTSEVKGTHLARDAAFEQDSRVLVDELQLLEHLDPLLIVRKQLEVLLAERHSKSVH